jgi:hypothetical protein
MKSILRFVHLKCFFKKKNPKEIFTNIYNSNHWKSKESVSGAGSEKIQTNSLILDLTKLFTKYNIKSILDIPCGDFNWMKDVDLCGASYIGADIVENLIESNRKIFETDEIIISKFEVLNLISDTLPKTDIIINRDCLVHLSFEDCKNAIINIKLSKSKYLLTTTFTNRLINKDIVTGDWRTLNLQLAPFNFPPPLFIINEGCTEGNGAFTDKSMALYEISML